MNFYFFPRKKALRSVGISGLSRRNFINILKNIVPSISGSPRYQVCETYREIHFVIALYIGLSTTRFHISCSILFYILTHISPAVNIFLESHKLLKPLRNFLYILYVRNRRYAHHISAFLLHPVIAILCLCCCQEYFVCSNSKHIHQ